MDLRHNKRVLILGTCIEKNSLLARHVMQSMASKKWDVLISSNKSFDVWKDVMNDDLLVHTYSTVKSALADNLKHTLVFDQVRANTFYENAWTKKHLKEDTNLILVVTDPMAHLERELMSSFDEILMTKTGSAERQTQYHTLFIEAKKISIAAFKAKLKQLGDDEYLSVTSDHDVEVQTFTPIEKEEKVEAKSVHVSTNTSVPKNTKVSAGGLQFWVNFETLAPGKKVESEFYKHIKANPMMKNLTLTMSTVKQEGKELSIYLQVYERRKDLFCILIMNLMEYMKAEKFVKFASLVI